ncbi:MAG: MarR family transcriptional regulator [Rhodobacter sp.]|nr:MarR family transcriptional regulator [Rhodobacter sp.]
MPDDTTGVYFALFLEAGIIDQIGRAFLEKRLPGGLLTSHFGVVSHLIRVRDGVTPLELARAFQVPKTTMTHTLAGLETHGFVETRPNPADRRSKQVWLTEKGRRFRDDAIAAMAPLFAELERRFPLDKAQAMLPHLTAFREVVDRLRDEMD